MMRCLYAVVATCALLAMLFVREQQHLALRKKANLDYAGDDGPTCDKYIASGALDKIHAEFNTITAEEWEGELPEQCMHHRLIPKGASVLEIGGNIGRGTIMIGQKAKKMWTFEAMTDNMAKLKINTATLAAQGILELHAAISDVPMFVSGPWDISTDREAAVKLQGSRCTACGEEVPTTKVAEVIDLPFDTIVADCEGCFHDLVATTGTKILDNVNLIIYEDDARSVKKRAFLIKILLDRGFERQECHHITPKVYYGSVVWRLEVEDYRFSECFYVAWKRTNPIIL